MATGRLKKGGKYLAYPRARPHVPPPLPIPPAVLLHLCSCRDCEFFLDFSRGVLEAYSLFEVSTVGGGGPGARETLEIAQIKGTAIFGAQAQVKRCCYRWLFGGGGGIGWGI